MKIKENEEVKKKKKKLKQKEKRAFKERLLGKQFKK